MIDAVTVTQAATGTAVAVALLASGSGLFCV